MDNLPPPKRMTIGLQISTENTVDLDVTVPYTTEWKGKNMVRGVRIATLATLWLIPIVIFALALRSDWVTTWRPLHVPFPISRFVDLYTISSGLETLHNGGDPLVANPTELLHRPMNYPRVWLYLFSAAGITRGNTSTVALIFCVFYLTCMSVLIVRAERAMDAVIILLASLSIAPLHGMERGNNDLFVFSLIFLACIVTNKYFKSGLFAAAGLLKIFPIAAMMVDAIRRPRKERMLAALLTGLVILLVLLQWHDLILIRKGTPIGSFMSYGVLSLQQEFLALTFQRGFLIGRGWIVVVECWLAGALAITTAWRNPRELDSSIRNSRFVEMFSVFAGTYVFTYAVSGNWAYRLILLLPT
ncbi:MAG: hypothetical protein JWN92_2000, partial [Candidatus Acidoferrum typicum]|nr:hypothetical protein [Candidatus Acidoferrum typicum]